MNQQNKQILLFIDVWNLLNKIYKHRHKNKHTANAPSACVNFLFRTIRILLDIKYPLAYCVSVTITHKNTHSWDSRVQRRPCLYTPHMNSPQRSHQLSCVWLLGWKSCPAEPVDQSGSSKRTRSPTIRTTFSVPHLSRVCPETGGGPVGGANSIRSFGVKSCSSISSHLAILGT